MNDFLNSIRANGNNPNVRTENNALTKATSGSALVDLFFIIGSARGVDLSKAFMRALEENEEAAGRILLWARDVRAGAGERETFRDLFRTLISSNPDRASRILARVPELGRWDDVFEAFGTPLEDNALSMVKQGYENKNGLLAKWTPRNNKSAVNKKIREHLGLSPKDFRRLFVSLSKTVEQQMSAKEWAEINFEHVPSIAARKYSKAFKRHGVERYEEFLAKVRSGDAEMKAGAIFPHDVLASALRGDPGADEQWSSLPNYLEGEDERVIVVCDTSGSMCSHILRTTRMIDVCVGLGIYCAERLEGPFKNHFITFSQEPHLFKLRKGNLKKKVDACLKSPLGYEH